MSDFLSDLERLINKHSMENGSNTPDFILAKYLEACLAAFNASVNRREQWYGRLGEAWKGRKTHTELGQTTAPTEAER